MTQWWRDDSMDKHEPHRHSDPWRSPHRWVWQHGTVVSVEDTTIWWCSRHKAASPRFSETLSQREKTDRQLMSTSAALAPSLSLSLSHTYTGAGEYFLFSIPTTKTLRFGKCSGKHWVQKEAWWPTTAISAYGRLKRGSWVLKQLKLQEPVSKASKQKQTRNNEKIKERKEGRPMTMGELQGQEQNSEAYLYTVT